MTKKNKAIFFNCQTSDVQATLGVLAYHCAMLRDISRSFDVYFLNDKVANDPNSPARSEWSFVEKFVTVVEARAIIAKSNVPAVELCAHHFQPQLTPLRSIVFVFDLHLFDIPWKYTESLRQRFRNSVLMADAVVTMFPRTYYDLEASVGQSLNGLFLLDAPLLNKPPKRRENEKTANESVQTYIYPAQFQVHKNHVGLLKGLRLALDRGIRANLIFTGSDFASDKTPYRLQLLQLIDSLNLTSEVTIAGHVSSDALREHYTSADGMIIGSLAEGGAYVPLEGVYAGIPVALNALKSSRIHLDMLGANAHLFDSTEVESTAEAFGWLCNVDRHKLALANDGARSQLDRLSWAKVGEQLSDVMNWVAKSGPRPILSMAPGVAEIRYSVDIVDNK